MIHHVIFRRPPCSAAANEPNLTYAPGSPERAEIKARLEAMAGERIDIPLVIGGQEVRTEDRAGGDAAQARARARGLAQGRAERGAAGDSRGRGGAARLGELALGGARGGVPARGGTADDDVAADAQRGDDARPVEDGVPGGDRRGVRADRLLALQRRLRAGAVSRAADQHARDLEPVRLSRPRRASSTRSRRSTSPRSAATCRPRPR